MKRPTKIISIIASAVALLSLILPFIHLDGRDMSYIVFLIRNYRLAGVSTYRLVAFIAYCIPVLLTVVAFLAALSRGRSTMAFAGLALLLIVCILIFFTNMFDEFGSDAAAVKRLLFAMRWGSLVYLVGHTANLVARGKEKVY